MKLAYYYVPNLESKDVDREWQDSLSRFGLADRFENRPYAGNVGKGPDGGSGCFVAAEAAPGYHGDNQEWHEFDRFWIGWRKDQRPTPEDLQRAEMLPGVPTLLGDGQAWVLPVVTQLPKAWKIAGGKWESADKPGMDHVRELAERIREGWERTNEAAERWLRALEAFRVDPTESMQTEAEAAGRNAAATMRDIGPGIAVEILALNYRIGPEEVSAFGTLSAGPDGDPGPDVWAIVDRFLDGPSIRAERVPEAGIVGQPLPKPATVPS